MSKVELDFKMDIQRFQIRVGERRLFKKHMNQQVSLHTARAPTTLSLAPMLKSQVRDLDSLYSALCLGYQPSS